MPTSKPILVVGATGYIGARLVTRLLLEGYKVRAVARSLHKLEGCSWASHKNLELVAADVLDQSALLEACQGCSTAYYLVHSMNSQHQDFSQADRTGARNMTEAAGAANLERIIYLGGLGEQDQNLSKHLRSRAEVADLLRKGTVPVTVLRAAMIIGSGSASFEILRYLVDRLPFMITPKWVRTPSQPIAVRNVLEYLVGCLNCDETIGRTFDIGGPEVVTYQNLMDQYAEEAGLGKRMVVPVPYFTPRLSSYWIHLVTPAPSYIARPLAEGLKNPAICHDSRIKTLIPQKLLTCRDAIRLAISKLQHGQVESHWTDAGEIHLEEWTQKLDPAWTGGTIYKDRRSVEVDSSINDVWQTLVRIGGKNGWYYGNFLWKFRGILDRLIGGVGLSRGRRHAWELKTGDAVDLWRVGALQPGKKLLLIAEMKVPGTAILEFTLESITTTRIKLTQTAYFQPSGLTGIAYWKLVTPLHNLVFNGMLKGIVKASGNAMSVGEITVA